MITGAHAIIFANDPEKVRAFFSDVLGLPSVDAGGGWPIFALPPAELAAHPSDDQHHEMYLMCDEIRATVDELQAKGVEFTRPVSDAGWGLVTALDLPGGGELGLYEPRHPRPTGQAADRAYVPSQHGRLTHSPLASTGLRRESIDTQPRWRAKLSYAGDRLRGLGTPGGTIASATRG